MRYEVIISEGALDDLYDIYQWVLLEAGREIADAYYARLEARLDAFDHYPNRGSPRDDLGNAIRTMPFERRIIILYRVEAQEVTILRVVSSARELGLLAH